MIVWPKCTVVALAALFVSGVYVEAAPLVNLSIQGSTDGGTTWSNTISSTPGASILIRVTGQMAAVGTQNGALTISSLTSSDGIGSLKFNVNDDHSGTFSNFALSTSPKDWTAGSGPSAGTVTGHSVTGIRPIGANGTFAGAASSVLIWSSTFQVDSSLNGSEILSGSWTSGGTGAGKINNGVNSFLVSNTSETGANPVVSYAPLTVAVPEPTSMAVLGVSLLGLVARRRRQI